MTIRIKKIKLILTGKDLLLIGLVILVFLFLRLINLTLLPIFADEAIYVRWSQVMRAEPTLRFLPLSDGKQPLFMWLLMIVLRFFADPLLAGRLVSVLAGLGSLIGILILSFLLFKSKKISLISGLFYALTPFFVFFDRMALVDSLLMMLGIWVYLLVILLLKFLRLDLAMITGMVFGAALLTKSPALFFGLSLPAVLLLSEGINFKNKKKTIVWAIKLVSLLAVVYLFGLGIYNLLRLGSNFQMIAIRNKDYVFSFKEILSHPLDPLRPHLGDLKLWFPNLFTWPIFLLAGAGLVLALKRKTQRLGAVFLLLISLGPIFVQSVFARVFTPRYLLFASWPWLVLSGLGAIGLADFGAKFWKESKYQWLGLILGLALIIPCLTYDIDLLVKPEKAPLPRRMRSGYLEDWTAGQGIKEIAEFIKAASLNQNIFVGTEGFFGTLPDGLQIYLEKTPGVTVIGVGYPIVRVVESLTNSLVDNDVYLVVNQSRFLIPAEAHGLEVVREYPKAVNPEGEQDRLLLLKLNRDFWLKQ
jgi:4-amino-4-deoxy-L-arabinose transferase-like glycosyltransferase